MKDLRDSEEYGVKVRKVYSFPVNGVQIGISYNGRNLNYLLGAILYTPRDSVVGWVLNSAGLPKRGKMQEIRQGLEVHLIENDPFRGLTVFVRGNDKKRVAKLTKSLENEETYRWLGDEKRTELLGKVREELERLKLIIEDGQTCRIGRPREGKSRTGLVLKQLTKS